MDFVRKNWAKLAISLVALVGIVLTTVLLFTGPVKNPAAHLGYAEEMYMSNLYSLIAQMLFFVALAAYPILRMFDQTRTVASYVLLGLSVLAALFAILTITSAMDYVDFMRGALVGNDAQLWALDSASYAKFVNLIVFAALPLVYGLKKVFKKA